jgi:hypothetical protein
MGAETPPSYESECGCSNGNGNPLEFDDVVSVYFVLMQAAFTQATSLP